MINGLDIYYSKNIGRGLKPISQKANGLKPISTDKQKTNKGGSCKKVGSGLKILQ